MSRADAASKLRGPLRWDLALVCMVAGAILTTTVCRDPHANPDSHAFEAIARSLLRGEGLSYVEPSLPEVRLFAFRNPLYPILIAVPLAVGGVTLVLALQGALAGFTTLGIAAVAQRLAGDRAAWLAWALAMLWAPSWGFAGQLLSEVVYIALSVLAVERALAALQLTDAAASMRAAALAGLAAGASMLTRSPGVAVASVLVVMLARRPRAVVAFAIAAILVWLPWPIRNHSRLHAFVPLATNGQMNFFAGNSDVGIGECWEAIAARQGLGELGFERYFASRTRTEVLSQPVRLVAGIARRAVHHVAPLRQELPGMLLVVFDVAIAVSFIRDPRVVGLLALPLAVFCAQWAIQALTVVGPRYRHPTEWLVLVVLAVCIATWPRARGRIEAP